MIAVDTNILVYAHRRDSSWHGPAFTILRELAESPSPWAIPAPCLHEFLAIVTHERIYDPPSDLEVALGQVGAWLASPAASVLAEGPGYFRHLEAVVRRGKATGPRVHDARIAALCQYHGVRELWSADRDFTRFSALTVRNPLVG